MITREWPKGASDPIEEKILGGTGSTERAYYVEPAPDPGQPDEEDVYVTSHMIISNGDMIEVRIYADDLRKMIAEMKKNGITI